MLGLLAQTTYTYTTTTTSGDETGVAGVIALLMAWLIVIVPLFIFSVICMWKIFEKAGVEGWKALIPIYNSWTLAEVAGKPGWWGIVGIAGVIPILGIVASIAAFILYIIIAIELAKKFGKDTVFAIFLLVIFSLIGMAILAFGSAKYQGAKPAVPKAA